MKEIIRNGRWDGKCKSGTIPSREQHWSSAKEQSTSASDGEAAAESVCQCACMCDEREKDIENGERCSHTYAPRTHRVYVFPLPQHPQRTGNWSYTSQKAPKKLATMSASTSSHTDTRRHIYVDRPAARSIAHRSRIHSPLSFILSHPPSFTHVCLVYPSLYIPATPTHSFLFNTRWEARRRRRRLL